MNFLNAENNVLLSFNETGRTTRSKNIDILFTSGDAQTGRNEGTTEFEYSLNGTRYVQQQPSCYHVESVAEGARDGVVRGVRIAAVSHHSSILD